MGSAGASTKEIFLDVAELPRERREPALRASCAGDPGLGARVRRLLEALERSRLAWPRARSGPRRDAPGAGEPPRA